MPEPRPLPLSAWTAARREMRARRRRLRHRACIMAVGLAALIGSVAHSPRPHLVWNASASAPIGLYRVWPGVMPGRGDMVVARLPVEARDLAARRHYLPTNVPLVKRVEGVAGDRICASGADIIQDGRIIARRLGRDRAGRQMPGWQGCLKLGPDGYFLLMDNLQSFDGRYFGASARHDIIGKAVLLWAR